MRSRPHLYWAGLIVVTEVLVDQLSKQWAQSRLSDGRTIGLVPTLELDLTYNSGFSFSTGSGQGSLIGVLVAAVAVFLVWQILRDTSTRRALLMAAILGGALGNLGDRLFRANDGFLSGEVIDFIDVSWYAVFNLADTFVVVSVLVLVAIEIRAGRQDRLHRQERSVEHCEAGSEAVHVVPVADGSDLTCTEEAP